MAANGRIDVHHHVLPEFYIKAQKGAGIRGTAYRGFPEWTPSHSMSVMDNENIAAAILSFTSPGIWFGDIAQTRDLARQCNDYLAGLTADHSGRLGGFASLPLPDIDASIEECSRALDDLELDGINSADQYRRKIYRPSRFRAALFGTEQTCGCRFHPSMLSARDRSQRMGYSRMLIDYPFETTRVAVNLILQGVVQRYPNIKFILSHSGGTLPFLAHRTRSSTRTCRSAITIPKARCLISGASGSTQHYPGTPSRLRA